MKGGMERIGVVDCAGRDVGAVSEKSENISLATDLLRKGGVVAFPTETVYGLGADAANPQALLRIFKLKKRPLDHPLIIHIGDAGRLNYWASRIPDDAWRLAELFWPGPLTLILPRRIHVLTLVTGGQEAVGLRVPDHPVALALLRSLGEEKGLAAPSANRFGRVSPTTADHVRTEFGDGVDMILDGGPCRVGLESTIVGFTGAAPVLLRPGGIPAELLEDSLGRKLERPAASPPEIRASGCLPSHYAPSTPLEVWSAGTLWQRAEALSVQGKRVAILEMDMEPPPESCQQFRFPMPTGAKAYGRALYATLRAADSGGFDLILAQMPPQTTAWQAVDDRLRRAATLYCPGAPLPPFPSRSGKPAIPAK